jgi:nucleoid-associated protein YgaU
MILSNRVRNAAATVAVTSAVAIAVAVTGSVHAGGTPQPGRIDDLPPVPSPVHSPPGREALGDIDSVDATSYVVAAGDSYWRIAEQILPAGTASGDVALLTNELMTVNASTLGHDNPAMIHPGDVLDLPSQTSVAPAAVVVRGGMTTGHTVVDGDSYWAIAESLLGAGAAPADVLAKTEQLIELNSARLGYTDPQMLHPGDIVYLDTPVALPAHKAPAQALERIERPTRETDAPKQVAHRDPVRVEAPSSAPRSETAIVATSGGSAEETPAVDATPTVWHSRWNRFVGEMPDAVQTAPAAPTPGAHGRAIAN